MTLFPVVLPVAQYPVKLAGKQKVALLSRVSRQALRLSADRSGVTLGDLSKDEDDVPLPSGNHYWSVSHKPRYAAAVVSSNRIGIDIEEVKPRTESIFGYVASDEEWRLCTEKSWDIFFRYWTAKEAVLKAVGIGLAGLKVCKVVSIPDEAQILLDYQDHLYRVAHLRSKGHIVSITKDDNDVEWLTPEVLRSSGHSIPPTI